MAPFMIHDLRRTRAALLHEQGFGSDIVEKAFNYSIGGYPRLQPRGSMRQRKHMLQTWTDCTDTLRQQFEMG